MAVPISDRLYEQLLTDLAYVKGCSVADLQKQIDDAGGDLEIKSKEGQAVAARVESYLGVEDLIHPEDQKAENLTTVSSLATLIGKRAAEAGLEGGS